jgi:hypothetical protein
MTHNDTTAQGGFAGDPANPLDVTSASSCCGNPGRPPSYLRIRRADLVSYLPGQCPQHRRSQAGRRPGL